MGELSIDQRPESWGAYAKGYDAFASGMTVRFAEDALRLVPVSEGTRVLDVGAGTGALTLLAARRGARVQATDFAPGMVELLRQRVADAGLSQVEVACMDGQALQLPDASFDAAFSIFGLIFFPDHDAGFRELRRCLVPGGRAVVTAWSPPSRVPFFQFIFETLLAAVPDLKLPDKPPHSMTLSEPEVLRDRMLQAGFSHVVVHAATHLWTFESPEWLWERVTSLSPALIALIEHLDEGQREAWGRVFVERLRQRQGQGPFALSGEALLAVGTR